MKSFKVEVIADSSGAWTSNSLRFKTHEEAVIYGREIFIRWTAVKEWRVVESEDAPNRPLAVQA